MTRIDEGRDGRGMPHTLSESREPGGWPSSISCRDRKQALRYEQTDLDVCIVSHTRQR